MLGCSEATSDERGKKGIFHSFLVRLEMSSQIPIEVLKLMDKLPLLELLPEPMYYIHYRTSEDEVFLRKVEFLSKLQACVFLTSCQGFAGVKASEFSLFKNS